MRGKTETLASGGAAGVAYKARAALAGAGASCRRGIAGVRGERRGTSLRVKTMKEERWMDAIDGRQIHLPLRVARARAHEGKPKWLGHLHRNPERENSDLFHLK